MKTMKLMTTTLSAVQHSALVVAAMVMVSMTSVEAAVTSNVVTGDWNAPATWVGGSVPQAADSVIIASGANVSTKGARTCAGITVHGTLTMASTDILTVNGDVSGDDGTLLLGNSTSPRTISLTGNWSFNGTSSGNRAAVTCTGSGNQTLSGKLTTAIGQANSALTIDKTAGSVTLLNAMGINTLRLTAGTFDTSTYTFSNAASTLTAGTLRLGAATRAENLVQITSPVGTTIEYYNANPTIDGSITYQNLTFSGSGTAGASAPLTIQGTLANTGGGTLNFGANDVTLSGAVAANNIAGFTTTGGVTVNKTSGTATLMGNVNATALTMTAGTLNLGTGLTHTLSGNWTRNAGTLNGGSSTLKIGGSVSGTGTFTSGTGTVEWNAAGAQSIAVLAYNNLSLSGSGVKTVASGTSISGNLSIAPTGSATASLASGLNFNVDTLTLGGVGRINGTWGSTTATSATHKNDIYFDATTGYLTVTTSTAPVDSTAPTPNPMTFASAPVATSPTSISMTATTATDLNDVQYYFACTAGGGHDSVWQVSPTYEDTGLTPSTLYTYTVKARDQSPANNETAASGEASATTTSADDSTPPTPDPMTFASAPTAIGPYSITMTATTATDLSGVEYLFACTAGAGGHNSGWTNSTIYVDTGLTPNTLYTYTVTARDKSLAQNTTTASTEASATTDALDTTAPTPNPMTFASAPAATGPNSISMTATTAIDDLNGVEYYFTCTAGGGNNSGWQDSAIYEDTGLTPSTLYTYTVTARDKSPAQNVTSASTGESATTDADTTAPTPSPMTWASAPAATGPFSISMTATTASDPSGVEYYFTCTAGGGHDSGWTNAATYVDTGLTTNTTYTYTVTVRDKSLAQNATSASDPASATTLGLAATWDGSAGDQLWLTTANWTPAYAPNNVGARALIDRPQMATPGDAILDVTGNTVTVGQIDIESTATFSVTLNGGGTGKMVFDNGGSSARWNIETIGAAKSLVTVKLGNVGYVLADDLVINSLTTTQFRPTGTLTNAPGESHSVTYTGTGDYKLAWTARNTGGTIVDAGQLRGDTDSLDSRIGIAASGPDLLLKNGGRIFVGENNSHTLSRSVEIGSGGGKFVSDAGDSLTFSGVISGAGELTVSKTGTGLATVDLAGTATNTLTGNVVLLNPQTGAGNELLVVADKVGAFGQTPLLTVGTNVIVRITDKASSGEGAIDDDATVVRLMSATSVFDVATGVDEKLGKHKLQLFNGTTTTFDTVAAGTYNSSTASWLTGGGTVTVDTGPIGTLISFF